MTSAHLVSLQLLLYAPLWLLAATTLREELSALRHWLGYALSAALAIALMAWRPDGPIWLTSAGVSYCLVLSLVLARRGVERFLRVPPRDREYSAILLIAALALAWIGPQAEHHGLRVAFSSVLSALLLLGALASCWNATVREFSTRKAWMAALPVVAMAVLNGLLALNAWQQPELLAQLNDPQVTSPSTWAVLLISAAAFNYLFLFLVVQRLVDRLHHQAHHDPLTGLLNRRAMTQALQTEWLRMKRLGTPFTLISIDIDHFKHINDVYGHDLGDQVLCSVAECLRQQVRLIDSVGRMGGEEFLVLMPGCAAQPDGLITAERLRLALTQRPLKAGPTIPMAVTASWGVTDAQPQDADVQQVLQRADAALYAAKRAGRNHVMLQNAPEQPPAGASDAGQ